MSLFRKVLFVILDLLIAECLSLDCEEICKNIINNGRSNWWSPASQCKCKVTRNYEYVLPYDVLPNPRRPPQSHHQQRSSGRAFKPIKSMDLSNEDFYVKRVPIPQSFPYPYAQSVNRITAESIRQLNLETQDTPIYLDLAKQKVTKHNKELRKEQLDETNQINESDLSKCLNIQMKYLLAKNSAEDIGEDLDKEIKRKCKRPIKYLNDNLKDIINSLPHYGDAGSDVTNEDDIEKVTDLNVLPIESKSEIHASEENETILDSKIYKIVINKTVTDNADIEIPLEIERNESALAYTNEYIYNPSEISNIMSDTSTNDTSTNDTSTNVLDNASSNETKTSTENVPDITEVDYNEASDSSGIEDLDDSQNEFIDIGDYVNELLVGNNTVYIAELASDNHTDLPSTVDVESSLTESITLSSSNETETSLSPSSNEGESEVSVTEDIIIPETETTLLFNDSLHSTEITSLHEYTTETYSTEENNTTNNKVGLESSITNSKEDLSSSKTLMAETAQNDSTVEAPNELGIVSLERPMYMEGDYNIPKVVTVEYPNDTVVTFTDGNEEIPNNDFISTETVEIESRSENVSEGIENVIESRCLLNESSVGDVISGKLLFKFNEVYVPAHFEQKGNEGDIDVAVDGFSICDEYERADGKKSTFFSSLCNIAIRKLDRGITDTEAS